MWFIQVLASHNICIHVFIQTVSTFLFLPPCTRLTCLSHLSVAGVASHSRVLCVWRGGEGGHGGLRGREVQPLADGVHHLQRDHPPQLPQGQFAWKGLLF